MDGQRHKSSGGRRRRRKAKAEPRANPEPAVIAARRPNSPMLTDNGRKLVAASAAPAQQPAPRKSQDDSNPPKPNRRATQNQKRAARIVQVTQGERDDREKCRLRLLKKLMVSEGRGAISRAAEEYREAGFEFPEEQDVQLQLLEHFNEAHAREAVGVLSRLLEKEPPIKRPIFDQRLRRLEEYADEASTRDTAAQLRRTIRA